MYNASKQYEQRMDFKKMLGHTTTEMLEKVYGNYLPDDNFEFMQALFNRNIKEGISEKDIRCWTIEYFVIVP